MVSFFLANGCGLSERIEDSDLVLVNSCCVTEDKIVASRAALDLARSAGKNRQVLLAGCMADLPLPDLNRSDLLCIGPAHLDYLDRHFPCPLSASQIAVHRLSPAFYEPGQGLGHRDYYLMIARGCVNNCSYCNIKRVKGEVRSEPSGTVLDDLRHGLAKGAREFVLLADDCASYGRDRGGDLAQLMADLLAQGDGFSLKLNYLFPRYVADHLPDLMKVFAGGRVSYVNIPFQSGSQRILDLMNRHYDIDRTRDALRQLRALTPETTFCTHMMINFPTETEEDYLASLALAKEFDTALFLHYSDNSGTPAAEIHPKVPDDVARRRLDRASTYIGRRGAKGGAVISDFNCNMPYNLTGIMKES